MYRKVGLYIGRVMSIDEGPTTLEADRMMNRISLALPGRYEGSTALE